MPSNRKIPEKFPDPTVQKYATAARREYAGKTEVFSTSQGTLERNFGPAIGVFLRVPIKKGGRPVKAAGPGASTFPGSSRPTFCRQTVVGLGKLPNYLSLLAGLML
jgi:hypothetical protein